jgi:2,3-bisphosphoglycerate-dependent phosphoglycerate mutase
LRTNSYIRRGRMSQVLFLIRHCHAAGQERDAPLTQSGRQQAIALADRLCRLPIARIISSPFVRGRESIRPLAERLGLPIEDDGRLVERVLSSAQMDEWRERLAATFEDLDLCFEGGESSRTAMVRGVAVINDAIGQSGEPIVIVTHGNLMTLILKHFDERFGYEAWENLRNPDVYCIKFNSDGAVVERMAL